MRSFFLGLVVYGFLTHSFIYFVLGSPVQGAPKNSASTESAASGTSRNIRIVGDGSNTAYHVELSLGGKDIPVLLDTGSSDLWVFTPEDSMNFSTTDVDVYLRYGDGAFAGPVGLAEFRLGVFNVPSQAFVNATKVAATELFTLGIYGVLGLSFDDNVGFVSSPVHHALTAAAANHDDVNSMTGYTAIHNIFLHDAAVPTFFDIHLGRAAGFKTSAASEGTLTIGEHAPEFSNVDSMPKLSTTTNGRWAVSVTAIHVNGRDVLPKVALDNTLAALLDTGATKSLVPAPIFHAIYGSIPGSKVFEEDSTVYTVPCTASANLTIAIGGQEINIHPLDLSLIRTETAIINSTEVETTRCVSAWSPFTLDHDKFSGFDILLGASFLRNVYASYHFGVNVSQEGSYVQLLPVTAPWEDAYAEFYASRSEVPGMSPLTSAHVDGIAPPSPLAGDKPSVGPVSVSTEPSPGLDQSQDGVVAVVSLKSHYGQVGWRWNRYAGFGNRLVTILLCIVGIWMCLFGWNRLVGMDDADD